jgi:hypothetical protein
VAAGEQRVAVGVERAVRDEALGDLGRRARRDRQRGREGLRVRDERVRAQRELRGAVRGGHELARLLRAELLPPLIDDPARQRVVDDGVGRRGVARQAGALARRPAQDGVHQPVPAAAAALELRELDALGDGRVVGHAVEEQQLEEAEAQGRGDGRVEAVDGPRERGDVVVERPEALDGAEGELAREGPLAAGELARLRVQRAVGVGTLLGDPPHDGERGAAGGSH